MSHLTTIEIDITDLEALKSALTEFKGATFCPGQTTHTTYGSPGKCAHAIHVEGVSYEVGVIQKGPNTYSLAYDFWGPGQGLLKAFGEKCGKLVQMYGVHKATREARRRGYTVQRKAEQNGTIKLTLSGI